MGMDKFLLIWYNSYKDYESVVFNMSFSFLPRYVAKELPDLTVELLKEHGIKLLMLDFDNTIVPYTTDVPTQKMAAWLQKLQGSDIRLCVVSNSKRDRVKRFCEQYGLDCITHARKPFSKGIVQCLVRYQIPKDNCALVGDQIFTDTLGANCAGISSILVKAIHNHNIWLKLRHVAEMPFIWLARGRSLVQ